MEVLGRDRACGPARECHGCQEGRWDLGTPRYFKSAWADANGVVSFSYASGKAAAINVRVQWPGSTTYGPSTSTARGAYWK